MPRCSPPLAMRVRPGMIELRAMKRELTWFDWGVRVPIGFLWMIVIAIVAVPVMIYMTLLYYTVQVFSPLFRKRRAARPDREERVA